MIWTGWLGGWLSRLTVSLAASQCDALLFDVFEVFRLPVFHSMSVRSRRCQCSAKAGRGGGGGGGGDRAGWDTRIDVTFL